MKPGVGASQRNELRVSPQVMLVSFLDVEIFIAFRALDLLETTI